MDISMSIDLLAGTSIATACSEAQRIADMLRVSIKFRFNGVECAAVPGGNPVLLAERWGEQLKHPEGLFKFASSKQEAPRGR